MFGTDNMPLLKEQIQMGHVKILCEIEPAITVLVLISVQYTYGCLVKN